MWDALEAKYGVSDAGSELYVMEQFHDYRMVDDRSVVEQTHEQWRSSSILKARATVKAYVSSVLGRNTTCTLIDNKISS
jgi:hypothetical protein